MWHDPQKPPRATCRTFQLPSRPKTWAVLTSMTGSAAWWPHVLSPAPLGLCNRRFVFPLLWTFCGLQTLRFGLRCCFKSSSSCISKRPRLPNKSRTGFLKASRTKPPLAGRNCFGPPKRAPRHATPRLNPSAPRGGVVRIAFRRAPRRRGSASTRCPSGPRGAPSVPSVPWGSKLWGGLQVRSERGEGAGRVDGGRFVPFLDGFGRGFSW